MTANSTGSGGQDRRRHPRIKKNYIVRFYDKNNPKLKYDISQIENISQGGICFTSTVFFPINTVVLIELRTPYITDTLFLEGHVLQSKARIEGLIYENRVKFHELSDPAKEILARIEQYNSNPKAWS